MSLIWETLAKLIGLCFLEELSSLFLDEKRLGKIVKLVFGLLFIATLIKAIWQILHLGDVFLQINFEGLIK